MTNQVVVFQVNNQLYGIDIKDVNEIIHMQSLTSLPSSHPSVEGVTNLRGSICSVLNGHILLGLGKAKPNEEDKIIVLDHSKIGIRVDSVNEILEVREEEKKSFNGMEKLEALGYIDYLVDSKNEIVTVLAINKLIFKLTGKEIEELVA